MTKRLLLILAGLFMCALGGMSGCTGAPDSSLEPTEASTRKPTEVPTPEPAATPTPEPTEVPTAEPTEAPPVPTEVPTAEPVATPTPEPTEVPTAEPTEAPPVPTEAPKPVRRSDFIEQGGSILDDHPSEDCDSSLWNVANEIVSVGTLQWSPDGSRILFTELVDRHSPPVAHSPLVAFVEADGSRLGGIKVGPSTFSGDVSSLASRTTSVWEDAPIGLADRYAGHMRTFDLSADGSRIAFSTCAYPEILNRDYEIYEIAISNSDGTETQRLTENVRSDLYPVWSPDGTRVAFIHGRGLEVHTEAKGEWTSGTIFDVQSVAPIPPAWSPDGRSIAFLVYATRHGGYWLDLINGASVDMYTVEPDGSGLKRIVSSAVSAPSWSPDGKRIAVAVFEENGVALYTFAPDGTDPVMVVQVDPKDIVYRIPWKSDPIPVWVPNVSWSPDGSKIMYGALSVVNVDDGSVVLDTQLIRFEWVGNYGARSVDYEDASAFPLAAWSPDGSRIAMLEPVRPVEQMGYLALSLGYPLLYTMNSDGKDPHILVGWGPGGMASWPQAVRLPADVETCSKGIIVPDPEENPGLVEDCRTLLGMRDQLAGSGTLTWSSDTRMSRWLRVGVSGEPLRVRTLHISDFTLQGELYGQVPPEIGNLAGLRELTIDMTHLNGRLPPEIGRLANLESLEIRFTHMGGSIPAEIGNLTNLKRLILTDSQFSVSSPAEIGGLANLESLVLRNNNLSGHIPPEIGNLTNLRFLDVTGRDIWKDNSGMHGNLITGLIPSEMGNMVSLEEVLLFGNRLTGRIPADLGNLSNLTGLYLEGNKLSGCIPKALRALRDTDIHRLLLRYCE